MRMDATMFRPATASSRSVPGSAWDETAPRLRLGVPRQACAQRMIWLKVAAAVCLATSAIIPQQLFAEAPLSINVGHPQRLEVFPPQIYLTGSRRQSQV